MLKKQKERSEMMNTNDLDDVATLRAFFFRKAALEGKQGSLLQYFLRGQ